MIARRALFAISFALAVGLASGCALMMQSPSHVGGGASLGDAAAAANPDSSRKQRRLDVGYTLPPERGETTGSPGIAQGLDEEPDRGPGGAPAQRGRRSDAPGALFGVVVGGGALGGSSYDGFGEYGLDLGGFVAPRWRVDLIGIVSPIQFSKQTIAGQSFRDEFDLNLDLTVRYYLTPPHTFMGVYPLGGLRFGTLFWDYAKPVAVVEDGRPRDVKSDQINHFSCYGGMGVSLVQTRHFQLGGSATSGVRIYSGGTLNGFSNTLFPSVGFVQGRIEAGYRF